MKKYRVFKGGGQQMNPTAMWFAQMGAQQPSQEEMMMMQQQQQGQQGPPQGGQGGDQISQLAQQLSKELQDGTDLQDIIAQLMQAQVPPQAIMEAFNILLEQGVVDETALQEVASMLRSSQGGQEQGQPSEEEMMMMQQQQMAQGPEGQAPMARKGYINKRLKMAQAGMANESGLASDTNLIANKNIQKNDLLNFTQQNVMSNQFGQEYDQMYAGGSLEQARYGRGKARRAERQGRREEGQGDNWAKNQGKRARQLARRAVKEMPGTYSKGDKRALREGLESGEFDKYDVYRGMDVFNPQPQSKPGYPEVAGAWDQTMIPGKDWGNTEQPGPVDFIPEEVEETVEENVITDSDGAWDYKKENGILYTRRKGSADWIKVDPESNAGRAIRKKVYGEDDVTFDEGSDYIEEPDEYDTNSNEEYDWELIEANPCFTGKDANGDPTYDSDCEEEGFMEEEGQPAPDTGGNSRYGSPNTLNPTIGSAASAFYTEDVPTSQDMPELDYTNSTIKHDPSWVPNQQYGGSFGNGGAYELEQARFGRGRARRQARRAERQGRRALGQMDKAMRGAYGNIAFPPGASPMMAGMPMMGTQGAMSPRMHFEGERGLFGRLKNFKMDIDGMGMPMNFSRGMFMNGIFNPWGGQGQGGYNDTAYKISYPGRTNEIEEVTEDVKKDVDNKKIEDKTKQKGTGSEECETCDDGTTMGKDADGNCKPCPEAETESGPCGADQQPWNGECVPKCDEGYVLDEETGGCMKLVKESNDTEKGGNCTDKFGVRVSRLQQDAANAECMKKNAKKVEESGDTFAFSGCSCYRVEEGSLGTYLALGTAGLVMIGGVWYWRRKGGSIRKLTKKGIAALGKGRDKVLGLFKKGEVEAAEAILKESGVYSKTFKAATPVKGAVPKGPPLGISGPKGSPVVTPGKTPIVSSNTNRLAGSRPALLGPGGKAISEADRALLGSKNMASSGLTREALEKIAKKYGIKVAGKSTGWILRALRAVGKIRQEGGAIDAMNQNYGDPDLYRFTGGGHPGFVDYFANDGYYDDGGYYSEDINDPYMPYMEPGGPIVNRPYATAAEYGNEYASYPGPYAEPMITDSIRRSVIDSRRLIDGITDEEIEPSTIMSPQDIYKTLMDKDDPNAGRSTNQLYKAMQNPGPGAQYGGYQEGDEVYMTGGELAQYLAGGGQVEFID